MVSSTHPSSHVKVKMFEHYIFSAALCAYIAANRDGLQAELDKHACILFRGFDVTSAQQFNDFVMACGKDELPYIGGAAPRTNVCGRVFTSNEVRKRASTCPQCGTFVVRRAHPPNRSPSTMRWPRSPRTPLGFGFSAKFRPRKAVRRHCVSQMCSIVNYAKCIQ